MAAGAASLVVLLLCCWRGAELQPIKTSPGSSTKLPINLRSMDDDVATVFDEILVQEILDPNKSGFLEAQRPFTKSPMNTKTKSPIMTNDASDTDRRQKNQLSSEKGDGFSFTEEDKETMYQIKSLAALEKIIDSLRRALGNNLKQKSMKYESWFKGAKHHSLP